VELFHKKLYYQINLYFTEKCKLTIAVFTRESKSGPANNIALKWKNYVINTYQ